MKRVKRELTPEGVRNSVQQEAVFAVLMERGALTSPQIREAVVARGVEAHPASIRKALKRLVDRGHLVMLPAPQNQALYARADVKTSWFRCDACETAIPVRMDLTGSEIEGNLVENGYVWGTCRRCRAKVAADDAA